MLDVLKKLNYSGQQPIVLLNAPPELRTAFQQALPDTIINTDVPEQAVSFALVFATKQTEIDAIAPILCERLVGDSILWFAYPKGTSKKYRCDFNRDTGWQPLGNQGFEGVRQVAIDADWSALRFRRVEFIKSMTRDSKRAMSDTGKAKTAKAN